jgi:MFS family permease
VTLTSRGTDPRIEQARRAVSLVFALNGLAFASWAARSPAIRDELGLTSAGFGLLLLCFSIGSLTGLPLSGLVVGRFGPARSTVGGSLLAAVGLVVAAFSISAGSVAGTAPGLVLIGLGISAWDVAMNVEGADIERRLGRSLMPRLHAGFSLGTVVGAGLGALAAAGGVPVSAQLHVTAVVAFALVLVAVRWFVPPESGIEESTGDGTRSVLRAWLEPRTLLLGVMVLAFALSEGIANDWVAIAVVDGYAGSEALGAATFGAFVAAMTLARVTGGSLLTRWGRTPVLRASAGVATVGAFLLVLDVGIPVAIAGAVLWGLGSALGFPVGMSAAADDPRAAAGRVAVVSSIGYTAFLAGPPLIGFLADATTILQALLVVPVALLVGFAVAGVARPEQPDAVALDAPT